MEENIVSKSVQQEKQQMNENKNSFTTQNNRKSTEKISENENNISNVGGVTISNFRTNTNYAKTDDKNTDRNNIGNKRKKPKSRLPNTIKDRPQSNFYKNDLDIWLETCLNDSNTPQLSSSSEFLDYNTSSFCGLTTSNNNKETKNFQPQFFTKSSTYTIPHNQGVHKTIPDNRNFIPNALYFNSLLKNSHVMIDNETSCDFASLPPILNLTTTGEKVVINGNFDSTDPNRRFSDPCLINASDHEGSKFSGQNTPSINPEHENLQNKNNKTNNQKLFLTLMEQINLLHQTNSKICQNLHDTKSKLESFKEILDMLLKPIYNQTTYIILRKLFSKHLSTILNPYN